MPKPTYISDNIYFHLLNKVNKTIEYVNSLQKELNDLRVELCSAYAAPSTLEEMLEERLQRARDMMRSLTKDGKQPIKTDLTRAIVRTMNLSVSEAYNLAGQVLGDD